MQQPGDIVLVSCYEPGHQPQGVASAVAFLRRAGFAPTCLDLAVEELDASAESRLAAARLVAISVPMHTAMALGLRVAARVRAANPTAHISFCPAGEVRSNLYSFTIIFENSSQPFHASIETLS